MKGLFFKTAILMKFIFFTDKIIINFNNNIKIADNYGPYYWHIKSGNIQREPPELTINSKDIQKNIIKNNQSVSTIDTFFMI